MPKTVLITGASRGLGRAIAMTLAAQGYDIAINYRQSEEEAQSLKEAIESKGQRAVLARGDVANEAEAQRVIETAMQAFGRLDALVNNAGVLVSGTLDSLTFEDYQRAMHVNVASVWLMSKYAAAAFKDGGAIVNISSGSGIVGPPNQSPYATSKAAVNGLTKALANELAPRGIRVNAVAPGLIPTDMTQSRIDEGVDSYIDTVPLGRLGEPQDIAEATAFLLSDAAGFITGQILPVNGGRHGA